jgi:hypothetical protein
MGGETSSFVPPDFEPPSRLVAPSFVLEPLGAQHNVADFAAWSSSIEHIRATPGFPWGDWPHEMTLADNLGDLEQHAGDFEQRAGFTYTVLDPDGPDVIGCVYVYPPGPGDVAHDAAARSWVCADRAELDEPLWRLVSDWLAREWPFHSVAYAARG